ncbi:MAG: amylo-alpha-1,6-glucosidase, partial [Thermomicrobia bacterium]|nr:amylo-alpha-1,6-glucosidase [Thermomicrobia bacterium]
SHDHSNHIADIGASLTLKQGSLFMLTDDAGDIPPQTPPQQDHGLGLYFHDMRYLDAVSLRINGARFTPLLATADHGHTGIFELTNPDLDNGDGTMIPKETLGLRWKKTLSDRVHDELTLQNFGHATAEVVLTLEYDAHFDDMFTVRGAAAGKRGMLHPPRTDDDSLVFRYDGADGHRRTTTLTFDPQPTTRDGRCLTWRRRLAPGDTRNFTIAIAVADIARKEQGNLERHPETDTTETDAAHAHADAGSLSGKVHIETSNALFDRVLRRSFLDLAMLATRQKGDRFFAAGVPWYVALFGRDSLITALEVLAYEPAIARNTLDLLAQYQGTKQDDYRDEAPGKILHELRVGEKANLNEVPSTPYYGTVDATPLFLILLGEYVRWTGDLDYFKKMERHVARAVAWMEEYGDSDGDGFLDYASGSATGLTNQGWKDSGNSIVNADGSIVTPPVALAEVQGYAYKARRSLAALYRRCGDSDRADRHDRAAETLRERFNKAFWVPKLNNYAQALQKKGQPAVVDASNQGQALWGGIVDDDRAPCVRDTLMDPDKLFAGWGIRTLSHAAAAYNPFDYQVGAIWPHDNALIVAGLRRYGFDGEALQVFTGIYEAATRFDLYRLPELFAGFGQDQYRVPVQYPVACSPQAWAAARAS